jgi:hypothetical protein
MNGYAATADPGLRKVDCAWCGHQEGDYNPEDCPVCHGVGHIYEEIAPRCGFCHEQLVFLQRGGYPTGYPRHEIPEGPESQMRGNAQMGRVRIVE